MIRKSHKKFKVGDTAIFKADPRNNLLKHDLDYFENDNRKVVVYGKGSDGWDYTIRLKTDPQGHHKFFCNSNELRPCRPRIKEGKNATKRLVEV